MKITTKLLATCMLLALLAIATAAQAGTIYTIGYDGQFGTIDTVTRAYNQITSRIFAPGNFENAASLSSDGLGGFYTTGADLKGFYSVTAGGDATQIAANAASIEASGMSRASNGTIYAYNKAMSFGTIDPTDGKYTLIAASGMYADWPAGRLAFLGDTLYAAINDDGTKQFGTFNLATGAFTRTGLRDSVWNAMLLASDGTTLYGISGSDLYTITPETGARSSQNTITGTLPTDWAGAAFATSGGSAVPEPATLLGFGVPMLMVGLGKLRGLRK